MQPAAESWAWRYDCFGILWLVSVCACTCVRDWERGALPEDQELPSPTQISGTESEMCSTILPLSTREIESEG